MRDLVQVIKQNNKFSYDSNYNSPRFNYSNQMNHLNSRDLGPNLEYDSKNNQIKSGALG